MDFRSSEMKFDAVKSSQGDYSCTCTSHKYWIMHVIFERSRVTVRNIQARCCGQQDWLIIACCCLTCHLSMHYLFTIADLPMSICPTDSKYVPTIKLLFSNRFLLVKKTTLSKGTVVVAYRSQWQRKTFEIGGANNSCVCLCTC